VGAASGYRIQKGRNDNANLPRAELAQRQSPHEQASARGRLSARSGGEIPTRIRPRLSQASDCTAVFACEGYTETTGAAGELPRHGSQAESSGRWRIRRSLAPDASPLQIERDPPQQVERNT